jgi:hypothetical protein
MKGQKTQCRRPDVNRLSGPGKRKKERKNILRQGKQKPDDKIEKRK